MFEAVHDVLPSEVWANGAMKPRSLVDALQNTADMAVRELDADTQSVLSRGYAWVMVQGNMSIHRWAGLGEKIVIRTWHKVTDGLYIYRAFDVRSGTGEQLAKGATSWILIDLARARPVKPKQNLPEIFLQDGESNPEVEVNFENMPREIDMGAETSDKVFEVRAHDIDANDHVNNAVYIEWAVESVPNKDQFMDGLLGWEVMYRKGAHFGDSVVVRTTTQSDENSHTSFMHAGDKFLCTVKTRWDLTP